jgi:hypothetical protein
MLQPGSTLPAGSRQWDSNGAQHSKTTAQYQMRYETGAYQALKFRDAVAGQPMIDSYADGKCHSGCEGGKITWITPTIACMTATTAASDMQLTCAATQLIKHVNM